MPEEIEEEFVRMYYVDIPNYQRLGPDEPFVNVKTFLDKKEAIEWMRENIDSTIDDDGKLRILTS